MAKTTNDLELTLEITEEKAKGRRESNNDFSVRLARQIAKISEDDWDELPTAVQSWFNDAANKLNQHKLDQVPDFPGLESEKDEEEEKPTRGRRGRRASVKEDEEKKPTRRGRRAKKEETEEEEKPTRGRRGRTAKKEENNEDSSGEGLALKDVSIGDRVKITRSRGSVSGVVKKLPSSLARIYIETDEGKTVHIEAANVKSIEILDGSGSFGGTDDTIDFKDLKEEMVINITKKDGDTVTGEVVEIASRSVIVYDLEEDEEVKITKSKIKSIEEVGEDGGKVQPASGTGVVSDSIPITIAVAAEKGQTSDEVLDEIFEAHPNLEENYEDAVIALVEAVMDLSDSLSKK